MQEGDQACRCRQALSGSEGMGGQPDQGDPLSQAGGRGTWRRGWDLTPFSVGR